jgi:hypothetical protein
LRLRGMGLLFCGLDRGAADYTDCAMNGDADYHGLRLACFANPVYFPVSQRNAQITLIHNPRNLWTRVNLRVV